MNEDSKPENRMHFAAPETEPLMYDIKQAAKALNTCTKTIRRLIARQYLAPCRVLRKILIPRKQLEEFAKKTCGVPRNLQ